MLTEFRKRDYVHREDFNKELENIKKNLIGNEDVIAKIKHTMRNE